MRKPFCIAPDLLIQAFRRYAINSCKVRIKNDLLSAYRADQRADVIHAQWRLIAHSVPFPRRSQFVIAYLFILISQFAISKSIADTQNDPVAKCDHMPSQLEVPIWHSRLLT